MARAKKTVEAAEQEPQVQANNEPQYDLYSVYQEHFKQQQKFFEDQQKKVLEYWTNALNNAWWWKK